MISRLTDSAGRGDGAARPAAATNIRSFFTLLWGKIIDATILDIGPRWPYTAAGGPAVRRLRAALSRRPRLNETIFLPARFVDAPIFRRWSGDSQKLYFWLRARAGRDDSLAPDEYRRLRDEGYLVAYATAEEMMDRAVDCSRNTLTKLIRALEELEVARVRPARRGYLFLLGERVSVTTRGSGRAAALEIFYLDQIVASATSPGGA